MEFLKLPPGRSLFRLFLVFSSFAVILIGEPPSPTLSHEITSRSIASVHPVEPCGTWIALEGGEKGEVLREPAARPPDGPLMRDSAHFRVHYPNGELATYADSVLSAAEKAYRVFLDTLGFIEPPSDTTRGGDSRTDIYIQSSAGFPYLGRATPESWTASPFPNSYTSYIELTDTMGMDLLLTTTSHEYFHVVQIGYDKDESVSFLEMTAVWSEDLVYDEINAYLRYLPNFYSRPYKPLFSHTYSNVVWAIYLAENFGNGVIKDILETCAATGGDDIRPSTESVLSSMGSSLSWEFAAFTLWNFFTGSRDDGLHYEEGSTFPLVSVEEKVDCLPLMGYLVPSLHRPGTLACNYFEFYGDSYTDSLRVDVMTEYWAESFITATRFTSNVLTTHLYDYPQFSSDWEPVVEPLWAEADSFLLIYNVEWSTLPTNAFAFSACHPRTEPPTQPFVLILDRDGCRKPFDGINDDFSTLDGEDIPFAEALAGDSIRFVLSDSIPDNLSACDAIFIIGGYDGSGVDFLEAELESLMAFMDGGGDVYLESNRIGEWIDPAVGQPSPAEAAFWDYFGCDFQPGDTMTVGNVTSWNTLNTSPLGKLSFLYDGGSLADNFVGRLVPTSSDTLAVDQAGHVRAVIHEGLNGSYRIHSTVLLGASRGMDAGFSRSLYLYRFLETIDAKVPALSIAYMNMTASDGRVELDGRIEGYSGEPLSLVRCSEASGNGEVDVAMTAFYHNKFVQVRANDSPPTGQSYTYRLFARIDGFRRMLWEGRVTVEAGPLSIEAIYPNPSRGAFTLVVDSPTAETVKLRIYDAAGRLVFQDQRILRPGTNEVFFEGPGGRGRALASGVYFLRLDTPQNSFQKKVVVVK